MTKILFFACDPGGANAIIPVIKTMSSSEMVVFGKNGALQKYQDNDLSGSDIAKQLKGDGLAAVAKFVKKYSPDLIITGTSANDMTEKYLWQAAEKFKIPSLAILDQWMNYGIRFSRYGLAEIKKYEKNKVCDYQPTKILVMDSYAKRQLVKDGIRAEKIIATGNPYFEQIIKSKNSFSKEKIINLRQALGLDKSALTVLFASEPFRTSYTDAKKYWGFTEEEILLALIDALTKLTGKLKRGITLIIKLHPKEAADRYDHLIKQLASQQINIIVEGSRPSLDLIMLADLVCGMFSMLLQEALILNKPIVSIAIGLNRPTGFVLETRGLAKSIRSKRQLDLTLKKIIINKQLPKINLVLEPQAIKKVIKVIKNYVQLSN